ncbi:DUF6516 family protein [Desulfobacterales bacterium HSG2]|nr:DUF6516 family protein [Desulfobacterales bacterium HSG2]
MMRFKDIRNYYFHVRHKATTSDCTDDWNAIRLKPLNRCEGSVRAEPLNFKDGSLLRFKEKIVIDEAGFVHRPSYSYHYEGPGNHFHFRYDRDPEHQRPVVH